MKEGVSPSRIIFAHPCKPTSYIKYAAKIQLPLMTFDSKEELYKIKECYPEAQLVLRIRCDSKIATYTFGKKYGVDVDEAFVLLSLAAELDLQVIGVAFHVGSGCRNPAVYQRAIASAREVFDEEAALGMKPYLLDIGGGFSGNICDLGHFASVINAALGTYFPQEEGLQIIAEPGRYIVTSAFTLATRIMAKKCFKSDDNTQCMYFINDGVYGSFSTSLFEKEPFTPNVLTANKVKTEEGDEGETVKSTLWGPTCCALDVLKKSISLPRLECGDWLYWQDMGAYTLTNTSNFNGFPLPNVYVMISPECRSRLQEPHLRNYGSATMKP